METSAEKNLVRMNQLSQECESIYYGYARRIGFPEAALWVLYGVVFSQTPVTQYALCQSWHYSKQTVNSAVVWLTKEGYLEKHQLAGPRNRKQLTLTKAGKLFCRQHIEPLRQAELSALEAFTPEEISVGISFRERHLSVLRKALDGLDGQSDNKLSQQPQSEE